MTATVMDAGAVSAAPVRHSKWTLLILMAAVSTIPAETVVVVEGFGTLTRLLGLVAALATILDCIRVYRLRRLHPAHAAMGAFFMWNVASLLWTVDTESTLARVWLYCQLLVFVWIVHELSDSEKFRRAIIAGYVAGAVVASGLVFRAFLTGVPLITGNRYGTAGSDPNDLALSLVIAVPLAIYLAASSRSTMARGVALGSLSAIIGAILLTGSRGGLLALLASGFATLMYFTTPRKRVLALLVLVVLASVAYLAWDMLPATLVQRYVDIPSEMTHGTMAARRTLWRVAAEVFLEKPATGCGAGGFLTIAGDRAGTFAVAHNTYLSVAAELGAVGVVLFALIIARITQAVRRRGRTGTLLWLSVILAWGVGAGALTWEAHKATWLIFGLFAGYGGTYVTRGAVRRRIAYAGLTDRVAAQRWRR